MNTSIHKSSSASRALPLPALRLLLATCMVALAAGFAQTASAAPGAGPAGHGHHGAMGGGFAGGHHIERMLDAVNATPEQRAQIKPIVDAARADLKAQFAAGHKLREQSQALFAQPNIDVAAIEVVRQQMVAQHDQSSKRMTQVMIDVSRVLTPDQRKLLADRMAQRRSMMERHRAERGALEKGKS